jgi:phage shock protein A
MPAALVNKVARPVGEPIDSELMRDNQMIDEEIEKQIAQLRMTAATMGDAALDAISRGDAGLARTAARQAAQYARIVVQLQTGEKQFATDETVSKRSADRSPDETIMA